MPPISEIKTQPNNEAREWAQSAANKLKMLESRQPESSAKRDEANWKLVTEFLESFYRSSANGILANKLEEQAAMIYDNQNQAAILAQMRGYYFENISRYTPLDHRLIINFPPLESDEDIGIRKEFTDRLAGLDQRTVFELKKDRSRGDHLSWDKGALISHLISQELLKEMSDKEKQEYFIYVPALDNEYSRRDQLLRDGKVIIRFDPKTRLWVEQVAKGKESNLGRNEHLLHRANQLNKLYSENLTLPDAVILERGQPVGVIETKCWHTEELEAFTEHISGQPPGTVPDGKLTGEDIDIARAIEDKPRKHTGTKNFDLTLRLAEEIVFVETSTGKRLDNALLVLRFPGNIPPDVIESLLEELKNRGFKNILIQQILIDAEEVELIAQEFMQSETFVQTLEERYKKMKSGEIRAVNADYRKNIKARAIALGINLDRLKDWQESRDPLPADKHLVMLKANAESHRLLG